LEAPDIRGVQQPETESADPAKQYRIDIFEALCKSCGICVAFCPCGCLEPSEEDLRGKVTIGMLVDRDFPIYVREYRKVREAARARQVHRRNRKALHTFFFQNSLSSPQLQYIVPRCRNPGH